MGYTLVKGGGEAIRIAEDLVKKLRRTGRTAPVSVPQVEERMELAVGQVMGEGSLYSTEIAALAVKQAEGDLIEASFLVRAYRTTLPRLGYSVPSNTDTMSILRRVSSAFKDVPGGQILGATRDYTPHLLDFSLLSEEDTQDQADDPLESDSEDESFPQSRVIDLLRDEGMVDRPDTLLSEEPFDITREVMVCPAPRSARLQALARGESGAMLCLAYSSLRGFGAWHPTIAELRVGYISLDIVHPYTGEVVSIGKILVTECECLASPGDSGSANGKSSSGRLNVGYGLVFGHNERKAISMSILDGTTSTPPSISRYQPTADHEFVFYHIDAVDALGFVEHLKLPHYVDFQSALHQARKTRSVWAARITGRGNNDGKIS